jgi:DNA repair protein RecO (recombination protein O)
MPQTRTPAILLRRVEYGDYDLILTFLTRDFGKMSAIAKSARKSAKRFAGRLELFAVLRIFCNAGNRGGLPILQEAELVNLHPAIRTDIIKTAHASYWAELIDRWTEEAQQQVDLFHLLLHVYGQLNSGIASAAETGIIFQIRLLALTGHQPDLQRCGICRRSLDQSADSEFLVDLPKGGLICRRCAPNMAGGRILLTRGTIKQLLWLAKVQLNKTGRIRFTGQALSESQRFLEAFLPYHLGQEPRSLKILRQIRENRPA